ncbi:MAG: nuclear transport factor 2 family protein [Chlorobi bacterium]|nr:nuclear transport factor 2 family protein [Chlorobiota bacterium]MBX7216339.1 nuclear transport factor 2 family protein [Candidatus Kapabacteria bacterium]
METRTMGNAVENLKKAHQAFSEMRLADSASLLAANATFTDHGRNQKTDSREEFQGWLGQHFAMASNVRIEDAQYVEMGNTVVAQFRAVGNQDGALGPFPPTGKPFTLDVCEVWTFNEEGQAIEGHNYSDGLGLLGQLGHISMGE